MSASRAGASPGVSGIRRGDQDAKLVAAAQRGDRSALEKLLRRHHDKIHAVCRRLAGNDADGMDATQEALIAIVRGLPRFGGRASFTTWAYRVATNAALDEMRRRSRRPTPGLPMDGDRLLATTAEGDPAQAAVRIDIDAALAGLPEEFRVPVVLRDVAGCDYAEIGTILQIPPGTVRSRIARGRARLAESLSAENESIGDGNFDTPQQRHRGEARSHE